MLGGGMTQAFKKGKGMTFFLRRKTGGGRGPRLAEDAAGRWMDGWRGVFATGAIIEREYERRFDGVGRARREHISLSQNYQFNKLRRTFLIFSRCYRFPSRREST